MRLRRIGTDRKSPETRVSPDVSTWDSRKPEVWSTNGCAEGVMEPSYRFRGGWKEKRPLLSVCNVFCRTELYKCFQKQNSYHFFPFWVRLFWGTASKPQPPCLSYILPAPGAAEWHGGSLHTPYLRARPFTWHSRLQLRCCSLAEFVLLLSVPIPRAFRRETTPYILWNSLLLLYHTDRIGLRLCLWLVHFHVAVFSFDSDGDIFSISCFNCVLA